MCCGAINTKIISGKKRERAIDCLPVTQFHSGETLYYSLVGDTGDKFLPMSTMIILTRCISSTLLKTHEQWLPGLQIDL